MSISALKFAVDSAYTRAPFWRYIRTDFQEWRGFQSHNRGGFQAAGDRLRGLEIQLKKSYARRRAPTLTKVNSHYVNTEIAPGKPLSTDVGKSAKQEQNEHGKATTSELIDALH